MNDVIGKIRSAQRIAIAGWPGSGKSTFAKRLGEKLGRKVWSIDKINFDKNGREVQESEFNEAHEKLLLRKAWIIEGNAMGRSIDKRLSVADIILFFDSNRFIAAKNCLLRIFKTKIGLEKRQGVLAPLGNAFKQTRHIFMVSPKSMAVIRDLLMGYKDKTYYVKSRREINKMMKDLQEIK